MGEDAPCGELLPVLPSSSAPPSQPRGHGFLAGELLPVLPSSSSPADYECYVHYTECKRPRPHQDASFLGLGLGCFRLRKSGA
ncbi:hypothetical protein DAI22_01g176900 [Oryza sativa Japonica Group]|nr:hypothetical protein DAI22_01g176900 [Oryza sativa Japonica Group]KAF2950273.1 hypothetical protein DAI22_01g176900 [Oryza sativa Japonica Group]